MKLSPHQERELAFQSQKAQEALLELLQNPTMSPASQTETVKIARTLLNTVQVLLEANSPVSTTRVPNGATRALLEERFAGAHRDSQVRLDLGQLKQADMTIQQLEQGQRPTNDQLIDSLKIFRSLSGLEEGRRLPVSVSKMRDVVGG
jgi:hypothetical protein